MGFKKNHAMIERETFNTEIIQKYLKKLNTKVKRLIILKKPQRKYSIIRDKRNQ